MVDSSSSVKVGHPVLMGIVLFWAIIEGCLTAWLVANYNSGDNYPSGSIRDRVKFLVFVSWWTVVLSAVYLAMFLINSASVLASIASHGVFISLTWLFWLLGAATFTASIFGGQRCSVSTLLYCNHLVATEAFAWIEFILMTIALVLIVVLGSAAIRRGDGFAGPLV